MIDLDDLEERLQIVLAREAVTTEARSTSTRECRPGHGPGGVPLSAHASNPTRAGQRVGGGALS